jgi:DNA-directed RNA polymerase subunit RPC12/RpoP
MQIKCTQCGADVTVQQDETFIECPFCASALFLDKRKVVFHYLLNSNFKPNEAEGNLKRWMAGNHTVKDLDQKAQIVKSDFYYFPVWYFKTKDSSGDKIHLQPAASTSVSEIKKLVIPAGALKFYDKNVHNEHEIVKPDVLYDSAQSWLKNSGVDLNNVSEAALVHIPFYQFTYNFNSQSYTAMVEASSGLVYSNVYPAKSEAPFKILFGLSIAAFIVTSIICYIAGFALNTNDMTEALLTAEVFKIFGFGLVSVPFIVMAYFIAKKV